MATEYENKNLEELTLEELIELEKTRAPLTEKEIKEQVVCLTFSEIRNKGDNNTTREEVEEIVDSVRGT